MTLDIDNLKERKNASKYFITHHHLITVPIILLGEETHPERTMFSKGETTN